MTNIHGLIIEGSNQLKIIFFNRWCRENRKIGPKIYHCAKFHNVLKGHS